MHAAWGHVCGEKPNWLTVTALGQSLQSIMLQGLHQQAEASPRVVLFSILLLITRAATC